VKNGLLDNKVVLITGAAKRIGRALALASARAGADVVMHFYSSAKEASATRDEIAAMGRKVWLHQADLSRTEEAEKLVEAAFSRGPVFGLVNSAAIFAGGPLRETTLADWQDHLALNLTAPFVITQAFARLLGPQGAGRVVNLLDWRALRPGYDHFAYTISKAALATMTESLALALAPRVQVNGLALGAILPPEEQDEGGGLIKRVPAGRWGEVAEVASALVFLLTGPEYITGEIVHVDGGRHLVKERPWTRSSSKTW